MNRGYSTFIYLLSGDSVLSFYTFRIRLKLGVVMYLVLCLQDFFFFLNAGDFIKCFFQRNMFVLISIKNSILGL